MKEDILQRRMKTIFRKKRFWPMVKNAFLFTFNYQLTINLLHFR